MASNSPRHIAAKEKLRSPSSSVSQQRHNFRNAFLSRLKGVRNQQVDRLRQITEENIDLDFHSLIDFQKVFQPDNTVKELLKSEVVMELLQQVENEVLQQQAEQIENADEEEMNSILNTHLTNCHSCGNPINAGDLCQPCIHFFLNSNFSDR